MNNKIRVTFVAVLSSALCAPSAVAQVAGALVQNPETGHYYRVYKANAGSWEDANAFVGLSVPCLDVDGMVAACGSVGAIDPHLATVTSAREEVFVDTLRHGEFTSGVLEREQTWIGGIQGASAGEPGDGWSWVNGEGNFPGANGGLVYTNWAAGEPNNSGNEDHLTLGRYGLGGGWNDELAGRTSIGGFIVEWDVPLDAGTCTDLDGCVTVEGQTLSYPANSNPNGGTVSFNSFEFLDDPARCGVEKLVIFGNTGIGSPDVPSTDPNYRPPMIIPPYLCGSPRFVVVAVDASDLVIETGTVGVIHDTATVLPGNVYPDGGVSICEDPIPVTPYSDGDPQYQDVVTWQATDASRMRETFPGVAGTGVFEGATGEFTNECGTSRARVKGSSYFGIGFHIDFGPGNEYNSANFLNNFNSFVDLTAYKLELLRDSVEDAIAQGAIIKNGDRRKMTNMVENAIDSFATGDYASALDLMNNFNKFVIPARYRVISGENFEGEHSSRGLNIAFMMRVKVIPYIPVP